MAEGDKLLEDFILITVLAKGDVTEYWSPRSVRSLHSSHTLPPVSCNSILPFLKAHVISKCDFLFLCVRWWG